MLVSTVHVKSGHSLTQRIPNDFFECRGDFCLNTFLFKRRNPGLICWNDWRFLQLFAECLNYVSNARGDSSRQIRLFFCSNDYARLVLTLWRIWLKYVLLKHSKRELIYWNEWCFSQLLAESEKYVWNVTVHSSSQIRSFFCSNDSGRFLWISWKRLFKYLWLKSGKRGFIYWNEGFFS